MGAAAELLVHDAVEPGDTVPGKRLVDLLPDELGRGQLDVVDHRHARHQRSVSMPSSAAASSSRLPRSSSSASRSSGARPKVTGGGKPGASSRPSTNQEDEGGSCARVATWCVGPARSDLRCDRAGRGRCCVRSPERRGGPASRVCCLQRRLGARRAPAAATSRATGLSRSASRRGPAGDDCSSRTAVPLPGDCSKSWPNVVSARVAPAPAVAPGAGSTLVSSAALSSAASGTTRIRVVG